MNKVTKPESVGHEADGKFFSTYFFKLFQASQSIKSNNQFVNNLTRD